MSVGQDGGAARDTTGDRRQRAVHPEALEWVIRMADEVTADWDGFTEWLEADPLHAGLYDHTASALRDAETMVAATPVAPGARNQPKPAADLLAIRGDHPRRSRRWIVGAVAASLLGVVSVGVWRELPQPYTVETAPGQQRVVALADGSSVVLAGSTELRLDRTDQRAATLERGEALFRVRHDPLQPFRVVVRDLEVVDLGTVFNIKIAGGRTRVEVAEGVVMIDPAGAALRLLPGQAAVAEGGTLQRRSVEVADVGGWRKGRLAFDDAPLEEVAADLSRQLGRAVVASPAVTGRTFRGTLDTAALKDRPELLGALLGVGVRRGPAGWTLEPPR